jgi:L-arabinose isomerase
MKAPRIGLLPLYVELYDQVLPDLRATVEPLTDQVCEAFASRKVDVIRAATCCVREQVEAALKQFDAQQVDMIVTLHLAYSPSLETVEALAATSQALLLLDTTLDSAFSRDVDPMRLLYNHGIHGVQDLAAMLRRHQKDYEVVAGHLSDSSVMDRVVDFARAAHAASLLKGMKTLGIGRFSGRTGCVSRSTRHHGRQHPTL